MAIWKEVPGRATDFAVDSDANPWIIGTHPVPGGVAVYRWNEESHNWDQTGGSGLRIACGDKASYVVNNAAEIYRCDPTSLVREKIAGKPADIAAQYELELEGDHLCVIGNDVSRFGFGIRTIMEYRSSDWRNAPRSGLASRQLQTSAMLPFLRRSAVRPERIDSDPPEVSKPVSMADSRPRDPAAGMSVTELSELDARALCAREDIPVFWPRREKCRA